MDLWSSRISLVFGARPISRHFPVLRRDVLVSSLIVDRVDSFLFTVSVWFGICGRRSALFGMDNSSSRDMIVFVFEIVCCE